MRAYYIGWVSCWIIAMIREDFLHCLRKINTWEDYYYYHVAREIVSLLNSIWASVKKTNRYSRNTAMAFDGQTHEFEYVVDSKLSHDKKYAFFAATTYSFFLPTISTRRQNLDRYGWSGLWVLSFLFIIFSIYADICTFDHKNYGVIDSLMLIHTVNVSIYFVVNYA